MKENKLHTPDGFRDYLFDEYALKLETERKISDTFSRYGYRAVSSPTLEYLEVFEVEESKGMYKSIDREGEILTLRSDMTPPMARIAATNFYKEEFPLRLSYIGNVFRYRESYQGKSREFTQAGVELMGAGNVCADVEVIALAVNSLLATGLDDFKVFIGQVEFFRAILCEAGFSDEDIKTLGGFIIANNFVEYHRFIDSSNIEDKQTAKSIPFMTGDIELVRRIKTQIESEKAIGAIERLEEIYEKLCSFYGLGQYVLFDLGMVGFLDYYTDIIFRGYVYGTGFSILDGGRYIISQYTSFPSAGFAININNLLPAIKRQRGDFCGHNSITLLTYEQDAAEAAYSLAKELRLNSFDIEIGFNDGTKTDTEANIMYANTKQIKKIIHLTGEQEVILINTVTGESKTVSNGNLLEEMRRAEL